jgi:hypothetical protein
MSGNIDTLEVEEKMTVSDLLQNLTKTYPKKYPPIYTRLFREEGKEEDTPLNDEEMVYVFVHENTLRQILNRTEGTYFYYRGEYETKLLQLFEKQRDGTSRWNQSDDIVFVPEHIPGDYIAKNYERVYP